MTARAHALDGTALDAPLPIAAIASDLGVSPRALQMQFKTRHRANTAGPLSGAAHGTRPSGWSRNTPTAA